MTNNLLQIKFKERLNKLSSMDYDNVECWQVQEAFNKAQIEWVRRMIHGLTQKKENPEQTINSIDDLQVLLTQTSIGLGVHNNLYYESPTLPALYMQFSRVSANANANCCPDRPLYIYLAEEDNVDSYLSDSYKTPDFEWAETFCTVIGNRIRIYTNDKFKVVNPTLTYFRKPREITFAGCINPNTGNPNTGDIESELKDDVIEIIIDEAVAILAGDVADTTNYQREISAGQRNS
jgi:hypothetical protein